MPPGRPDEHGRSGGGVEPPRRGTRAADGFEGRSGHRPRAAPGRGAEGTGRGAPAPVAWLAWFAACLVVWLALDDTVALSELLTGTVAAAAGATVAVAVRHERFVRSRIRPASLLPLLPALVRLVTELPLVAAVVWRRGVLRRPEHGRVVERSLPRDGDDRDRAGRDVLAATVGSLSPGEVVLDADAERGVQLVHELRGAP